MKNILLCICLLLILFNLPGYSQNNNAKDDWANLKRYTKANKTLGPPATGENRVVFMGNSITESWAEIDSSFF